MKFALVNNIKTEAFKGAKGVCTCCGSELIAKCGEIKIHHWAHKGNRKCDLWWENETQWHRSWKNNFPSDWQEILLLDEKTNEKHIADVRTSHGLTIEFQHSYIDQKEIKTREMFYKNMVWVVDGTRLKKDYPRFLKGQKKFLKAKNKRLYYVEHPYDCLPSAWLKSSVPVILDFNGTYPPDSINDKKQNLYCMFPINDGKYSIIGEMSRKAFVNTVISGEWIMRTRDFLYKLSQAEKERQIFNSNRQKQLENFYRQI